MHENIQVSGVLCHAVHASCMFFLLFHFSAAAVAVLSLHFHAGTLQEFDQRRKMMMEVAEDTAPN